MLNRGRVLQDAFRRLRAHKDPHRRGIEFQAVVAQLFQKGHFKVVPNAGTARPRQTDILATLGHDAYLIEAKWTQRVADVDDIDSLFSRLGSTPGSVTGVLVSISGFSPNAIARVESRRNRPILLVTGEELESILEWDADLVPVLRRKQNHLLVHGKVLFTPQTRVYPKLRPQKRGKLPSADTRFVFPDGRRMPWVSCAGHFGQFVFVLDLPDIDWIPATGAGVTVDIPLPAIGERDLLRFLRELAEMGWATGSARWNIQQATVNWHGAGAEEFSQVVLDWRQRYQGLNRFHHSEELCYQDVCEGGFYTLTANISASKPRIVRRSNLSFQLQDIPTDPAPLRHLSDTFGVDQPVYFRPRGEKSVTTHHLPVTDRVPFRAQAFVVETATTEPDQSCSDWVAGIVAENPYYRNQGPRGKNAPGWLPSHIEDSEWLICHLRSWHELTDAKRLYRLWSCEWASTSDALVVRAIADWDDLPDSAASLTRRKGIACKRHPS